MKAWFITAAITRTQIRPERVRGAMVNRPQTWESIQSLIVCAGSVDEARVRFETWIKGSTEDSDLLDTQFNKLVVAPVFEQLLTEAASEPIDWEQIPERVQTSLLQSEGNDEEQGFWADVNQLVRPGSLAADIDELQRELPEDIRSGLNWSADKQFIFVLSVLKLPGLPSDPYAEQEREASNNENVRSAEELEGVDPTMVKLVEREIAMLIQARNSAVAAWLFRKTIASTPHAAQQINIEPPCDVVLPPGSSATGQSVEPV